MRDCCACACARGHRRIGHFVIGGRWASAWKEIPERSSRRNRLGFAIFLRFRSLTPPPQPLILTSVTAVKDNVKLDNTALELSPVNDKMTMNSLIVIVLPLILFACGAGAFHVTSISKRRSSQSQLRMMSETPYDLAVIGAGPVGAQAAMVAASPPYSKKVVLIDAPRASGMLMNGEEDLSIGGPTGLFSKALRDTSKQIKVSTLRGMGLREESVWNEVIGNCVDLASSNAQDCFRQLDFCGVDYVRGFASFPDSGGSKSLIVTNEDYSIQTVKAENVLGRHRLCTL